MMFEICTILATNTFVIDSVTSCNPMMALPKVTEDCLPRRAKNPTFASVGSSGGGLLRRP